MKVSVTNLLFNHRGKIVPAVIIAVSAVALLTGVLAILLSGFGVKKALLAMFALGVLLWGLGLYKSSSGVNHKPSSESSSYSPYWIDVFGGINLLFFILLTFFSYGLAPLVPWNDQKPYWTKIFIWLSDTLGLLGQNVQQIIRGQSIFSTRYIWILGYILPILISSIIFVVLIISLARNKEGIDLEIPRKLYIWASVFAVINIFAVPVLVPDFWYPLSWGKMIVAGINPYYTPLNAVEELTKNLPLGGTGEKMMYGPLWAVLNGIVMWIVGDRVLLGIILFKVVLAVAWVGTLRLVWALLTDQPFWRQSLGIAIFGWLPISILQTVAEGHNDIIMVFFLFLWLYGIKTGGRLRSTLSLAASVLVKYVSFPLFILDMLFARFSRKITFKQYLPQAIAGGILLIAFLALFYRSPDFFAYLPETSRWHFFTLREVVNAIEILFGIRLPYLAEAARVIFVVVAGLFVGKYVRNPNLEKFWEATLAVMCAVLFSVSAHIWPWYLLWVVSLSALVPGTSLARWIIGVALAMPFSLLMVILYPEANEFYRWDVPTLFIYVFTFVFFISGPRSWFNRIVPMEIGTESASDSQELVQA